MRSSFIFYDSFLEAIDALDDDKQLILYRAIAKYALRDEEIELKDNIEKGFFALMKPQIDANQKRFNDGQKGGRPKKEETEDKKNIGFENKKPVVFENKNHSFENKKPNVNENVNANVNPNPNENENENDFFEEKEKISSLNSSSKSFKNPDLMFNPDINKVFEIYTKECFNLLPIGFASRNREFRAKILDFLDIISGDFSYFTDVCRKANALKTICERKIDIKAVITNHDRIFSGFYNREETQDDDEARRARLKSIIDAEVNRLAEEKTEWNTV